VDSPPMEPVSRRILKGLLLLSSRIRGTYGVSSGSRVTELDVSGYVLSEEDRGNW
jgi:trehalose-6-phosphatase